MIKPLPGHSQSERFSLTGKPLTGWRAGKVTGDYYDPPHPAGGLLCNSCAPISA